MTSISQGGTPADQDEQPAADPAAPSPADTPAEAPASDASDVVAGDEPAEDAA